MQFINDFVVNEEICNMNCEYCLTDTSIFHKSQLSGKKNDLLAYKMNSILKKNMDEMTNRIAEKLDIQILKISGGEILLIDGILDYLTYHSSNYKVVQLLTNGVMLDEMMIKELSKIKNLCIQISLDHHTLEGNYYRTKSIKKLQRILDNIDLVCRYEIPLEINCVITNKNISIMDTFCEYLLKYSNRLMLLPFPIRGAEMESFLPEPAQIEDFQKIIIQYLRFQPILPPKNYMTILYSYMKHKDRKLPCYFPFAAVGSFGSGEITPCANYWFISLGNLLKDPSFDICKKINSSSFYRIFKNMRHPLKECKLCFTPWDLINLYVSDIITIDELCTVPLYSLPDVRGHLEKFKLSVRAEK